MIKVTYGTNPPVVKLDVGFREPILIWDRAVALTCCLQLMDAIKRAWPDDTRGVVEEIYGRQHKS